jgi:hypothetical protein
MCHEARCCQLEGKLLSHSPQIGRGVHGASHVLSNYQIRPHDGKRISQTLVKIVSGTMCAAISSSISFFREKYSILFG